MISSEHFSLNPEVLADETTGTQFLALELPSDETRLRFVLFPISAVCRTQCEKITTGVQTRIEVFDESSQTWIPESYDSALPQLMLAVIEAASGIETSSFMDKTSRRNKANEISQELINQNGSVSDGDNYWRSSWQAYGYTIWQITYVDSFPSSSVQDEDDCVLNHWYKIEIPDGASIKIETIPVLYPPQKSKAKSSSSYPLVISFIDQPPQDFTGNPQDSLAVFKYFLNRLWQTGQELAASQERVAF